VKNKTSQRLNTEAYCNSSKDIIEINDQICYLHIFTDIDEPHTANQINIRYEFVIKTSSESIRLVKTLENTEVSSQQSLIIQLFCFLSLEEFQR
jgi:hypothetical protein